MEILQLNGCGPQCVTSVRDLSEHNILISHNLFSSKSKSDQAKWILNYFESHASIGSNGKRDVKGISYFIQGRKVCQQAWIKVHGISQSRFYRLRGDFEKDGGAKYFIETESSRQPKTLQTLAWMTDYFNKIGDKRPDKHGIYIPSCLTVKKMYNIMMEDLFNNDKSKAIHYSTFCDLFKSDFKHVTIPKVSCNAM